MPPGPLKPFLFFNLRQLALLKKTTLEKKYGEIMPPLLKFFATFATPLHRPMNNKYHFCNIVLIFGFRIQAKL